MEAKRLIEILRRCSHSGFPKVILNNRIFMQCYDIDEDSDIGFHYMLYVPPSWDDEFWDNNMVIDIKSVLAVYREEETALTERRKAVGYKPAMAQLNVHYKKDFIIFESLLAGELISTKSVTVEPLDPLSKGIRNCEEHITNITRRIKPGGLCFFYDGLRLGIYDKAIISPTIYFFRINFKGIKIRVPFSKSTFLGLRQLDHFTFSVQETVMKDIYLLAISLESKGLTEHRFGYMVNF